MIGRSLLHFRITAKLGEGGMGVVYRAEDAKLGRDVAIKILPAEVAGDLERRARFEREAKVLAGLSHPNIAAIHQVEEDAGTHFLVMECLVGEDLATVLDRGRLALEKAVTIALQIARGLDAAHSRGVVHRDLKPANVFLVAGGEAKILDFGLAKAIEPSTPGVDFFESPTMTAGMTEAGAVLGTAAYMSPEQARGEPVDRRADIWSFGCLLFEMLSERQAFAGRTRSDLLAAILRSEPDWSALPGETPPSIRRLLARCLAKEAHERMRDIADVAWALGEPAAEAGAGERSGRRGVLPPLGAVVVAFALGIGGGVMLAPEPERPTPQLPELGARFAIALPAAQRLHATDHPEAALSISRDGRWIAWVGGQSAFDSRLFVRRLDELEARPVADSTSARQPFFSPDGEWLAFFDRQGELKKTSLATGETLTILRDIPGSTWAFGGWGDDGRIVFSTWGGSGLSRVSADGGPVETISAGQAEWPLSVEVLPGSSTVLYTQLGEHGAKLVWHRLDREESGVLLDGASNPRYLASGHLLFSREGVSMIAPFEANPPRVIGPARPLGEPTRVDHPALASAVPILSAADDGTLVFAPASADLWSGSLVWIDRNGRRLMDVAGAPRVPAISFFQLSPDERQVALSYKRGRKAVVEVLDLERGISTPVFQGDSIISVQAFWLPDGKDLVIATCGTEAGSVLRIRADGEGRAEELFTVPTLFGVVPWSVDPSGTELAYTAWEQEAGGNNARFRRLGAGAEGPTYLATDAFEMQIQLSPDGRWVAYASDETGKFEIYLRRHPEGGQKRRVSETGGIAPIWSGDGGELFFQTEDGRRMMAAKVDLRGERPLVGAPRVLFEGSFRRGFDVGQSYDVSADGERFLMLEVDDSLETIDQIVVAQNRIP